MIVHRTGRMSAEIAPNAGFHEVEALWTDDRGSPGGAGGGFRVRNHPDKAGVKAEALTAVYELNFGSRRTVCGCISAISAHPSSAERRLVKAVVAASLIGLLPDVSGSWDDRRPATSLSSLVVDCTSTVTNKKPPPRPSQREREKEPSPQPSPKGRGRKNPLAPASGERVRVRGGPVRTTDPVDQSRASTICDRTYEILNLEIEHDPLGKPVINVGGAPGPAVSFSFDSGLVWAAVSRDGACGIDSADPKEFRGSYPFRRAFLDEEFPAVQAEVLGGREEAAAMLWSAKEATVKALGCGFHLIDPLEVRISLLRRAGAHLLSRADIIGRYGKTDVPERREPIPVLTFRFGNAWISSAISRSGIAWRTAP